MPSTATAASPTLPTKCCLRLFMKVVISTRHVSCSKGSGGMMTLYSTRHSKPLSFCRHSLWPYDYLAGSGGKLELSTAILIPPEGCRNVKSRDLNGSRPHASI